MAFATNRAITLNTTLHEEIYQPRASTLAACSQRRRAAICGLQTTWESLVRRANLPDAANRLHPRRGRQHGPCARPVRGSVVARIAVRPWVTTTRAEISTQPQAQKRSSDYKTQFLCRRSLNWTGSDAGVMYVEHGGRRDFFVSVWAQAPVRQSGEPAAERHFSGRCVRKLARARDAAARPLLAPPAIDLSDDRIHGAEWTARQWWMPGECGRWSVAPDSRWNRCRRRAHDRGGGMVGKIVLRWIQWNFVRRPLPSRCRRLSGDAASRRSARCYCIAARMKFIISSVAHSDSKRVSPRYANNIPGCCPCLGVHRCTPIPAVPTTAGCLRRLPETAKPVAIGEDCVCISSSSATTRTRQETLLPRSSSSSRATSTCPSPAYPPAQDTILKHYHRQGARRHRPCLQ